MKLLQAVLSIVFLALGAACVSPYIDYGDVRTFEVMQSDLSGYRLAAGDGIEVIFAYHPTRNILLTVRPDGKVSMPFAEEVEASGKTVQELDDEFSRQVSAHLKDSELSVVVRTYARQKVYVGGMVRTPRELDLTPGMTVFQAIAASGWFVPGAADESVVLVRHSGPGKRQAMMFDFSEDALVTHDVVLEPFDVVYVPQTTIARVGEWVDEHINNVLPNGINIGFYGFVGRSQQF